MNNWRSKVLVDFQEPLPPLSLVADPDDLLLDEVLLAALKGRNVELVEYNDPVAFRFLFEARYRKLLEQGALRLIIRVKYDLLDQLPYDILQMGRKLTYRLQKLFPKLAYHVVKQFAASDLEALYAVYEQHQGSNSHIDTCDFILRKVYKVPYDMLDDETELTKFLLSKHYRQQNYPGVIEQYLIEQLKKHKKLKEFPITELVTSASFFYDYLQNQWVRFLRLLQEKPVELMETRPIKGLYGKEHIHSFMDAAVFRLLDNLFIEGKLRPVQGFDSKDLPGWTHVGLIIDPYNDDKKRARGMVATLKDKLQFTKGYKDWLQIARLYGEIKNIILSLQLDESDSIASDVQALERETNTRFEQWMEHNYNGLKNLPYLPEPIMLHQVPHYLAALNHARVALLVLDGMSHVQWAQLRSYLTEKNFIFDEHSIFAWVPTVTSISRQALFTGEIPIYFPNTLATTSKEGSAWKLFWENHGVSKNYTGYEKSLGQGDYATVEGLIKPSIKVLGLVVDTIDELVHSAIQGQQGIYAELKLWLNKRYLERLLTALLDSGFDVYITSDHGNQENTGVGRISEGVLAETRGERVRIYRDRYLRDKAAGTYSSIAWSGDGLPGDVFVLLAKSGEAFISEGDFVVSHGGISLEEVIVPFVYVRR